MAVATVFNSLGSHLSHYSRLKIKQIKKKVFLPDFIRWLVFSRDKFSFEVTFPKCSKSPDRAFSIEFSTPRLIKEDNVRYKKYSKSKKQEGQHNIAVITENRLHSTP